MTRCCRGKTVKPTSTRSPEKDKGKNREVAAEEEEDEEEEDEDEDMEEDEEMGDDDDDDVETYDEIDPTAITGRRTRGVRVDYTSTEALRKAGFTEGDEEDEGEDSFTGEH